MLLDKVGEYFDLEKDADKWERDKISIIMWEGDFTQDYSWTVHACVI
jgi:hypothetical protein